MTTLIKTNTQKHRVIEQVIDGKSKVLGSSVIYKKTFSLDTMMTRQEMRTIENHMYNNDGTGLNVACDTVSMAYGRKKCQDIVDKAFTENTALLESYRFPFSQFNKMYKTDYIVKMGKHKKTGEYSYRCEFKITRKKTMDIYGDTLEYKRCLEEFSAEVGQSHWRLHNISHPPKDTDFSNFILNYNSEIYQLGKVSHKDDTGELRMTPQDTYVKNGIEVMFVRCGKNATGASLPNRIWKRADDEGEVCEIKNPWSRRGTCSNLREVLKENRVKRFTKLNKTEMVKTLLAM